ncbi:MAG: methyl-accepting chemotaxis protein [Desulfobulbaceae bacterium]|nr:methyl-accepting chemotaxis protein [Desulfobulbaceae bacterium]
MSASTKLMTALTGTALLAASMVICNWYGAMVQLQWAVTLALALSLAWAVTQALTLTNDLRRLGDLCRESSPGEPTSLTGTATHEDLAAIDARLTKNTASYRELTSTVRQGLEELVAQGLNLSSLVEQTTTQFGSVDATQQSDQASRIKILAVDAASIAGRFEHLTAAIGSVASTAQESTAQVGIIIGATEQMSVTINDISLNAEKARGVAGSAVSKVNAASNRVDELGAAALEISKVTDVIVEIAEQTKLLALNATIEAARAGEAGKGFAVVANEVKELALQTNNAIAEIRDKVEAMQHSTDNTIAEIGEINQTIKAVNDIVVTIAGAVDEQSVPSKDIVRQLNQGVNGINAIRTTATTAVAEMGETSDQINQMTKISRELVEEINPAAPRAENLSPLLVSMKQEISNLQMTSKELLDKVKALS